MGGAKAARAGPGLCLLVDVIYPWPLNEAGFYIFGKEAFTRGNTIPYTVSGGVSILLLGGYHQVDRRFIAQIEGIMHILHTNCHLLRQHNRRIHVLLVLDLAEQCKEDRILSHLGELNFTPRVL